MDKTIEIIYSCRCGINERKLRVAARKEDESIIGWMDYLRGRVSLDHLSVSPHCQSDHLTYLKIPVDNAPYIGGVNEGY